MLARLKKYVFPLVLVGGIAIFALTGRDSASGAEYTLEAKPEIIAATFSSAWCSACKILKPRLAEIIPDFADKPVKFVEFDFTLGQRDEIALQAEAEGLADIYPRFKGATGFTLLIDSDSGEIIDMLTISHSKAAMRAAIAQSIFLATRDTSDPVAPSQIVPE